MKRLFAAIVLSAMFAATARPRQLTKVRVAFDGFSMTSGPLNYADKQGIFKHFGLDITPTFVEGGSMLTSRGRRLPRHRAERLYPGARGAALARRRHRHHRRHVQQAAVPAHRQGFDHQTARSSRARHRDQPLRLLDRHRGRFRARHLKLKRDDVSVLQLGGAATRIAALTSGQVGRVDRAISRHRGNLAAGLSYPGRRHRACGEYPNTAYITNKTFLKAHPDTVKKFFMAMATAVHEYKNNPRIAIPLTQKFLDVKSEANTKAAYEAYVKIYPDDLQLR